MSKPLFTTLALLILLFVQTSSARTLGNPTTNPTHHQYQSPHTHQQITFLMRDIFNVGTTSTSTSGTNNSPKAKPSTTKLTSPTSSSSSNSDIPFSKPLGLFPPRDAVRVPETDLPSIGLSFPAKATLQELELGVVTDIEEDIFHPNLGYKSQILGKAQGMYVASSEDGRSHMMAMEVKLLLGDHNNNNNNGLRFFGVKKSDVNESHIAVIGGVGKFKGANGYATVKRMEERGPENKLLKFNVYLS